MTGTIAIIAALPGELKPLVSPRDGVRWERLKAPKGTVLWERREGQARRLAGCSGMGAGPAAMTLHEMERYATVDVICSVGWAGALDAESSAASVWRVAQVIDTQTGERFAARNSSASDHALWPVLASTTRVADAAEKVRLAATYGARLVDMEAATLARIAQARGLPFFCFKAVSDDAEAKLPDLNRFMMASGRLRMAPFLAHVAIRPGSWQDLRRLGKHSALAARRLAVAVQAWLDEGVEPSP